MRVTLTFELPDERADLFVALHGGTYASALTEIDNAAHGCLKHDGDARETLEAIRQVVCDSRVWEDSA